MGEIPGTRTQAQDPVVGKDPAKPQPWGLGEAEEAKSRPQRRSVTSSAPGEAGSLKTEKTVVEEALRASVRWQQPQGHVGRHGPC